jgi:fibronectin type 3 domain-containing protein
MMSRITKVAACFIFLVGALVLPSLVLAGSATVTWQPNTEADLAKYRVYWSTATGTYGSYKAEVLKGTTTYVANNLTDGQTYYFVLTAVDASGNESGFSSPPASKTIPSLKGKSKKK